MKRKVITIDVGKLSLKDTKKILQQLQGTYKEKTIFDKIIDYVENIIFIPIVLF